MRVSIEACDIGLTGGRFGSCALDSQVESEAPPLSREQRVARAVAGLGFVALAVSMLKRQRVPVAVGSAWLGVTHLFAAATAFSGCPELGAVPSLLLRRQVATECGPWEWLDTGLGIAERPSTSA